MTTPDGTVRLRRAAGPLIVGVLIGATLLGPAGAHVTTSVRHLWRQHVKGKADARYVNVSGDRMKKKLVVPKVEYTKPRTHTLNVTTFAFQTSTSSAAIQRSDSRGATG